MRSTQHFEDVKQHIRLEKESKAKLMLLVPAVGMCATNAATCKQRVHPFEVLCFQLLLLLPLRLLLLQL